MSEISDSKRELLLNKVNMSSFSVQETQEVPYSTIEDKLEYVDYLIERLENVITKYEGFLNENHHVKKDSTEVHITLGKKVLKGKMTLQ